MAKCDDARTSAVSQATRRSGTGLFVQRHHTGPAQSKIVLERMARTVHLTRFGSAAQLVGQFKTLCKAGGTKRVAFP